VPPFKPRRKPQQGPPPLPLPPPPAPSPTGEGGIGLRPRPGTNIPAQQPSAPYLPRQAPPAAPAAPAVPLGPPYPDTGSPLYFDQRNLQQTTAVTDIPLYYDPMRRVITPQATGVKAYKGQVAPYAPEFRQAIIDFREANKEALVEQRTQTERATSASRQQTARANMGGLDNDTIIDALKQEEQRIRDIDRQILDLVRSGTLGTPEGRQQLLDLDKSREEMQGSWRGRVDTVYSSGRLGQVQPMSVVEEGKLEIAEWMEKLLYGHTVEGMPVLTWLDILTRPVRAFAQEAVEKEPILDVPLRVLPVLWDIGEDWLGTAGWVSRYYQAVIETDKIFDEANQATGIDKLRVLARLPEIYWTYAAKPIALGGLRATADLVAIASGKDVSDIETATIAGMPISSLLYPQNIQTLQNKQAHLAAFRQAVAGLANVSTQEAILLPPGASEEARAAAKAKLIELSGTDPDQYERQRSEEFKKFDQTISDANLGFAMIYAAEQFRAEIPQEEINKLYDQARDYLQNAWAAVKQDPRRFSMSGRWSFIWAGNGPELEAAADSAIVDAMMQKGRWLKPHEIDQVTSYFTDFGSEFVGDMVFDVTNYISFKPLANLLRGGLGFLGEGATKVLAHVHPTMYANLSKFFTEGAAISLAKKYGSLVDNVAVRLAANVEDAREFKSLLGQALRASVPGAEDIISDVAKWGPGRRAIAALEPITKFMSWQKLQATVDKAIQRASEIRQVFLQTRSADMAADLIKLQADEWAQRPRNFIQYLQEGVAREFLAGSKIQGLPRALDEGLIAWFLKKTGGITEKGGRLIAEGGRIDVAVAQAYLSVQDAVRKVWIPLVLTARPAYTVYNYIDNAWRAVVHGVNPLLNIKQVLDDIDRTVLESWSGGFGASLKEGSVESIGRKILSKEVGTDIFSIIREGWNRGKGIFSIKENSVLEALRTLNNASEFVWRARVYHKFYVEDLNLMRRILRPSIEEEIAKLPEHLKGIAQEAWLRSGGHPGALLEALRGKGGIHSFFVTEELRASLAKAVGPAMADSIIRRVSGDLQMLVNQKNFTDEAITSYFDRLLTEIDDHLDARLRNAEQIRASGLHADLPHGQELEQTQLTEELLRNIEEGGGPKIEQRVVGEISPEGPIGAEPAENIEMSVQQNLAESNQAIDRAVGDGDISAAIAEQLRQSARDHAIETGRRMAKLNREIAKISQDIVDEYGKIPEVAELMQGGMTFDDAVNQLAKEGRIDISGLMASSYMQSYLSVLDGAIRGPARRVGLYLDPGPLHVGIHGTGAGNKFNQYFVVNAGLYQTAEGVANELLEMAKRKDWQGIAAYVTSSDALSASAFLKRSGWDFAWDGNELVDFITPQSNRALGVDRRGHGDEFRKIFNISSREEFETVPLKTILYRSQVTPSQFYADISKVEEAKRIWQNILDTLDDKSVTLREKWEAAFKASGIKIDPDDPEAFRNAAYELMALTESDPNLVSQLQVLKRWWGEIDNEFHQVLRVEGLTERAFVGSVPEYMLPLNVRASISDARAAYFDSALAKGALGEWWQSLEKSLADGSWFTKVIGRSDKQALRAFADRGSLLMSDGMDAVTNGGEFLGHTFEGAVPRTNRIMIDYKDFNQFDRFIKDNITPFWMFPSRSLPFWLETMVAKPWVLNFHVKYLQASRNVAYAAGATTRSGKQLPSLEGYIPIPGTNIWFNPLAAMSSRYILPIFKNNLSEAEEERMTPTQQIGHYVYTAASAFGMRPPPWVMWVLYGRNILDKNRIPEGSVVPQLGLVPRFFLNDLYRNLRGMAVPKLGTTEMMNPAVSWKSFLVERQILYNTLRTISGTEMSEAEKLRLVEVARQAISVDTRFSTEETTHIWNEAVRQLDKVDWVRNLAGYMTGFYGKQFTDADVKMLQIRNEINMLKSSLNNEVVANIFDMDQDAHARNSHYLTYRYDTAEGFLSELYNVIGYVQTPEGLPLYGKERDQKVAEGILDQIDSEAYYTATTQARAEFTSAMNNLPTGASREAIGAVRDAYADKIAQINSRYPNARTNNFIGYKPEKLVFDDFRSIVFHALLNMSPQWDTASETYLEFKARKEKWLDDLAENAPALLQRMGHKFQELNFLHPELNYPRDVEGRLLQEMSRDGYLNYWKENDSEWEALNRAYEEIYWSPYWDTVEGKKGAERTLAEREFLRQFPGGRPSDAQLIAKVKEIYGEKFTDEQLQRILNMNETYEIEQKISEKEGIANIVEDDLWDYLGRVSPGDQYNKFKRLFLDLGGDEDHLSAWYVTGGDSASFSNSEVFRTFQEKVKETIQQMGLPVPTDANLRERVLAKEQNTEFRASVQKELGEDFYSLLGYYMRRDREERRVFREAYPEDYERIQKYFDLREDFATTHAIWKKYYLPEVGEESSTSRTTGGGGGGGGGRGTAARRPSPPPSILPGGYRATLDARQLLKAGQLGKGGYAKRPPWPTWVLDLLGPTMEKEIADMQSGVPISATGVQYLGEMGRKYPKAGPTIDAIIKENYKLGGGGRGGPQKKI